MKIAIPTRNDQVDDHFGHCEYYSIFEVSADKQILSKELFDAPKVCGCKSGIATVLAGKGVKTLLAGNMGTGAVNKLQEAGLEVIRGCQGPVDELVNAYMHEGLKDSGLSCSHNHGHEHGHQCNH